MNDTQLMTLAREYGTPLYLFEQTALRDRVALLRECLPARAELCLAIKANPFALPIIRPYVHRLEVCSPGELNICEACGTAPEEIVLSGVYKDEAMVRHALSLGDIHRYTVESLAQFELLRRLAQEAGRRLPVLLRLTCGSQFGMDADDIRALVAAARDDAWIDIRGLQQFSGTQKTSLRRVERELACADALMAELEETCGFVCREFEYGPGLPVDYFDAPDPAAERAFLEQLGDKLDATAFQGPLTLEIGRGLTACCGTYLTAVVDAKTNQKVNYAIVDGGIHHLTYYGGAMAMKQLPVRFLEETDGNGKRCEAVSPAAAIDDVEAGAESWTICGSLCTTNDILVKSLLVRDMHPGRVLAFERAGAYCMTEGVSLLLSRELPAIVLADETGTTHLARPHTRTDPLNTPAVVP